MKFTKWLLLSALLSTQAAYAEDVYSDQFQTIRSLEMYEVQETEAGEEEILLSQKSTPTFIDQFLAQKVTKLTSGGVLMQIRGIIALGKEIYEIVKAGKPVVNINSEPIQILATDEKGETVTASEMDNWKAPIVKKYRVRTKNYLGVSPASFDFMLIYVPGGSYRGAGSYITGAQIKTTKVNVKWGYTLNANFKLDTITNEGTQENPVAGAVLSIDYKISTVLQEYGEDKTFYINGKGQTTAY